MNRKQLKKLYRDNRVMVSREFDTPIFIAPLKNGNIQITDKVEQAERWSELDTSKLDYHKAATGYNLTFEIVQL